MFKKEKEKVKTVLSGKKKELKRYMSTAVVNHRSMMPIPTFPDNFSFLCLFYFLVGGGGSDGEVGIRKLML